MLRAFHFHPETGKLEAGEDLKFLEGRVPVERGILWLDLEAATEDEFRILDDRFGLDPFVIQECIEVNDRPKLERFRDYIFLILHAPDMRRVEEGVKTSELNVVLMRDVLITVRPEPIRSVASTMEAVRKDPGSTIGKGLDFILYEILETMGENYVAVLDRLDDRIEAMEDVVIGDQKEIDFLKAVHPLRKDILYLRRLMVPQRETIYQLARGDIALISDNSQRNFRALYDHWVKLNDLLPAYRDSIASLMDAYTNIISTRANRIMQLFTVLTVILMPPMLIASIYGMNVKDLPGLHNESGGLMLLLSMALMSAGLYWYCRSKKFL